MKDVTRLLKESIQYSLDNREAALDYALQYGRDLERPDADEFVGMYVNELDARLRRTRTRGRHRTPIPRPCGWA